MNNGKICVSVCAETADELINQVKRAEGLADVIEIRFDCLKTIQTEILWKIVKNLKETFAGDFLVTLRSIEQGGRRKLAFAEREEFWVHSHVFEFIKWADLELDFSEEKINRYWGKAFDKVIKSFHDFERVPLNIVEIYNRLKVLYQAFSPFVK